MWKRLPEDEVAKARADEARRRGRLWPPLLVATGMSVLISILWKLGYRGGASSGVLLLAPGQSLKAFRTGDVFIFAFAFIFMFVVAYRHQRRTGHALMAGPASVICTRCQDLAEVGASHQCACGGRWETIDYWGWVDDPQDAGTRGTP